MKTIKHLGYEWEILDEGKSHSKNEDKMLLVNRRVKEDDGSYHDAYATCILTKNKKIRQWKMHGIRKSIAERAFVYYILGR